jgi:hypothetical protein
VGGPTRDDVVKYLDFDMSIEAGDVSGVARVIKSPFGEGSSTFAVPFTADQLEEFIHKVGRTRAGTRMIDSPEMVAARDFGRNLYDAVFDGEVGALFQRSVDEADREEKGLRLRLRISDGSTLFEVPWEFLYSNELARFLVLSTSTPLVRFISMPQKVRRLRVAPPLRVLVVVSSPGGFPRLDEEGEMRTLEQATAQLRADGHLDLHLLEEATFAAIRKRLRQGTSQRAPFHVLHFIGHGGFDAESRQGVLVLEDEGGRSRMVSGHDFGMMLHDHRSLRLAILNTCEGGRASRRNPFGGVAQGLVRQGIPAVIAMQFEVTDGAAKIFADEFYTALCDGQPIDAASAEARRAVFTSDNDVEWATPVVYLRSPDGLVFDVKLPAGPSPPGTQQPRPKIASPRPQFSGCPEFLVGTPVPDPLCFFGRYHEVKRLLQKLRVPPLQNAAIVGPKRSGKTSLLRHLRDISAVPPGDLRPEQRVYARQGFESHRWVYADFQDPLLATRAGLLRHLLGGVDAVVDTAHLNLDTFFEVMSDRLDRPTVFLLDEVGVALQKHNDEFDDTFWDAMRSLASSDAGRHLAFVLATHAPPFEIASTNEYASPFFNIIGYTATLGPFTNDEALELVNSSPVPFPPGDVEWIIEQTARWPILLQILCSERLNSLQEGNHTDSWKAAGLAQMKHHVHLLTGPKST